MQKEVCKGKREREGEKENNTKRKREKSRPGRNIDNFVYMYMQA